MQQEEAPSATILVVDDNADNRALARAALEDEGYRVVVAASGQEGIDAFRQHAPDCVLLDVRMPGMDGFATCAKLRGLPGGGDAPILFLTALRDVDTFDQALRAGGDDFLTKPVRPTELVLRVLAALKLRRMNAELREHVELVRRQRDAVMRLQLQKEQLFAFIVHDLKNPVNAIDLHAQRVLRRRDHPPSVASSAQQIRDESRSLLRLIYNLLDLQRAEDGGLTPRIGTFDLCDLAAQLLEAFEVRAGFDQITLASAIDAGIGLVKGDVDLMRRVLENLLDNAIRHSPEGGTIRVAARMHAGALEVRVSDGGEGVPPELRDKVFERFVQLEHHGAASTRGGRGLGLAFCRLAVEAHGGRIWIEDGDPGAVFALSLPQ